MNVRSSLNIITNGRTHFSVMKPNRLQERLAETTVVRNPFLEGEKDMAIRVWGSISWRYQRLVRSGMVAAFLLAPAILPAQEAPSSLFKVLEAFNGTNGNFVGAGPILDSAGNVYGITAAGGDLKCKDTLLRANGLGCGIVFEISNLGQLKVLHRFTGPPDGAVSFARLVRDSAGNLYGTTIGGGTGTACSTGNPPGCGTLFKVDKAGKETVLYNFKGTNGGPNGDGSNPEGVLVLDATGNIYGTTGGGGLGFGTVFKLDSTGKETVLYRFKGVTTISKDGWGPGDLVEDQAGNLYGTTIFGGLITPICTGGCGIVYKISKTGKETVLYRFTGDGTNGDGGSPMCTLAIDASGNLYGTTELGGMGHGTIFRISSTGKETVLHRFNGNDGDGPSGALRRDATGNLYGTAGSGGSGTHGVVFRLTKAGQLTVLHNFTGGNDGGEPLGGVVLDSSNNVYGTTLTGGDLNCKAVQDSGCGVVYKITH